MYVRFELASFIIALKSLNWILIRIQLEIFRFNSTNSMTNNVTFSCTVTALEEFPVFQLLIAIVHIIDR